MKTLVRLAFCFAFWGVSAGFAGTATITVDASKAGPRLNPAMYGIFLEEINHGVDGGLYAELIANRGFEDSRPPEGFALKGGRHVDAHGYDAGFEVGSGVVPRWSLVREGEARGSMTLETTGGLNEASPYCLRLDVECPGPGRLGVANAGFWGIGVAQAQAYRLVLHARGADFAGPLEVRLEDEQGNPCSTLTRFDGFGPDWSRCEAALTATRSVASARLVVTAGSAGRVWLDFVSLFPARTWRDRSNGLRPDIAQMIADLKPGFVRFPGGCVVEGGTIETAYDWKLTVGPVEQRPERWNAWNYRRTHGMGFLEYLEFCEDLGAAPMYVGFAGQTCLYRNAEHVPLDQMGQVVDGFSDAIAYATGPTSSTWGAARARDGHPRPFPLRLIEIGNENGQRQYEERYALIHSALKQRYPDKTYIADYAIPGASYDLVDDHYYNAPSWFFGASRHYDARDRHLPGVYVGEIAVTSAEGGDLKGNLVAALSEGAFLLGCERNADVVRMVSYAPLLAHVDGRSGWHGQIYFDSTRVFGTASYHLWKLFGLNRPDVMVESHLEAPPVKPSSIAGAIGVGTWETAAEFRDIRVTRGDATLLEVQPERDRAGWTQEGGRWSVIDGAWRQQDPVVGLSVLGDPSWSDYTLSLQARKLRGAEGFLIAFGRTQGQTYWWNLGGWGNREHGIERNRAPVGQRVPGQIETDRWYDIRVELRGRRIRCFLDGKLIHEVEAEAAPSVFAVAGRDDATGDLIVKAINAAEEPCETTIDVRGVAGLEPKAEAIVLTGDSLDANNSFEQPERVAPVRSTVDVPGARFRHELPARSLTILRLKPR